MDENQVLDAFEASMGPAEATETTAANPVTEAAQVEGADAPQAEEQVETKAESQDTEDAQTIEIDPDEPLFEHELEVDGKKVTVKKSLRELQQGSMSSDEIRREKQAIARQRDEIPRIVATQAKQIHEQASKAVQELHELTLRTIAGELDGVSFKELSKSDPWKYTELVERRNELVQLQQTIRKEAEDRAAKAKEEEQKLKAEKWNESLQILQRDIPDFGPPVVKRLIESAEEWGFSKEEVSQWDDHRLIKMLHALSDKKAVETKRPEVEKKVAVVTKVLKPGQTAKSRNAFDEAKAKLRKSGKPEDGIAVFEAFV